MMIVQQAKKYDSLNKQIMRTAPVSDERDRRWWLNYDVKNV